ncbi:MAG: hypothetical protein M3Y48_05930 [Actinomycetota bacterium]|nr:hypothetical protein [Actinomycetota bacterium]
MPLVWSAVPADGQRQLAFLSGSWLPGQGQGVAVDPVLPPARVEPVVVPQPAAGTANTASVDTAIAVKPRRENRPADTTRTTFLG